ncbi:translocation and assembly module lipoprotein TamL [Caecibacteroides pullorum]|uniref:BamA/TamA family outer membrane protein n=1 Tax=Caecibacteroides pullorum TaxID=2725562 RepID=A0AA41D9U9_9BACT|nr:BamA/TamA family outer membrane protein [Caecibacteroides pullorum]MBM6856727.1 BamA/TamA family outer membrane protein [Caecibacteroides pullorum]MBV8057734.1 BamA/TamA family outer membrane protein [Caecibacteroides pullorum]
MKKGLYCVISVLALLLSVSCSSTKYVPDGSYLLDEVSIHTDNKEVKPSSLSMYVRQNPNAKWFSLFKTQLYVYNWSGADSTRWINRVLRKVGDAPVIYRKEDADRTREEMTKAVQNMGYMGASVETECHVKKKKIRLVYNVATGKPYIVRTIRYDIPDDNIRNLMQLDSAGTYLSEGMRFDVNQLDAERQRITNNLLGNGYYKFNKDFLSYTADTARNTYLVDLTLHLLPYRQRGGTGSQQHRQYTIGKVGFVTDYNVLQSSANSIEVNDSLHYNGLSFYYKDKLYLRPQLLENNLHILPGDLYDERKVQRTYSNFGRLQALKYTNIRFVEEREDSTRLDAYIMLTKSKHKSVSFELEGTNSAGDLGAAAAVSFQHRNLFRGSEALMLRFRGAYEAISPLKSGYNQENYMELGAEATINFPRFMFPFLSRDFRRTIRATTEFGLQYNYQMRPEFTRIVASGSWSYRWGMQRQRSQHRIDLLDINYLYMPWIDPAFREIYLDKEQNYILAYNYEDRFIVRSGYSYTYNSAGQALMNNALLGNSYSVRINIESAGSLLYGLAKLTGMKKNESGEYTLLNIPFAQYIKGDIDYAKNFVIDNRNSLAFHVGGGIAVPYGNASVVPFEKRYFSGGANSVRGWSVRELGPGSYVGDRNNFLNQSGDIKLDASVEYRTHLFWKLHGALFVDAGNIWTLHEYESQPGGQFKFNTFYKQIAVAYGMGIRLDLDFFVLRFDAGMKAINPVYESGRNRYPIVHPDFSRDFAFHFAVGYPF